MSVIPVGLYFDQPPINGLPTTGPTTIIQEDEANFYLVDGRTLLKDTIECFGYGGWDWWTDYPFN